MGISKENSTNENEQILEENSRVIDRLYYHEFMMNELNAGIDEYVIGTKEFDHEYERTEFRMHCDSLKVILTERLIKDLKQILHMA